MMIMRPPQHGQGCGVAVLDRRRRLGSAWEHWHGEQLAGSRDVVGAGAVGEQAVVADAVEAVRQHMDQEAADELVGCERHHLVALAAFGAVVLPPEGDAVARRGDQAAVGDGDAVGVAGRDRPARPVGPPNGRLA